MPFDLSRPLHQAIVGVVVVVSMAIIVALIALWPTGDVRSRAAELGVNDPRYRAEIVSAVEGLCSYASEDNPARCLTVDIELGEGPDVGERIRLGEYSLADPFTPEFEPGDRIVVGHQEANDFYYFADRERRAALLLLFVLFVACVLALGRVRGVLALAALGLGVVVLIVFMVPSILEGNSPVLVSLAGAALIAVVALYVTHGVNVMSSVALLGILGALAVTLGLGEIFFALSNFSGAVDEEATFLKTVVDSVEIRGLLLGGVVVGALGALDDVSITQAATVWELRRANPDLERRHVWASAMRVGREHIGSIINTLLLAYAGASMPLLVLFVLSEQSLSTVANAEVMALEIVRTMVGSIGLLAAVPLTTWLAVLASEPGDDDEFWSERPLDAEF